MTNLTFPNGVIFPNVVVDYYATLSTLYSRGMLADDGYHPYLTDVKVFTLDLPLAAGSVHVYPDGGIHKFMKGKGTNISYYPDGSYSNRI
jgi:hypothetical protein